METRDGRTQTDVVMHEGKRQDEAAGGWTLRGQVEASASLARRPSGSQCPAGGASQGQLSRETQGQDPGGRGHTVDLIVSRKAEKGPSFQHHVSFQITSSL